MDLDEPDATRATFNRYSWRNGDCSLEISRPEVDRAGYRSTRRETPKESRRHGPTSEMSQRGILDVSTR